MTRRRDQKAGDAYVLQNKIPARTPLDEVRHRLAGFGSEMISAVTKSYSESIQQLIQQVWKETREDAEFIVAVRPFAPWFDLSETSWHRLAAKLNRKYPTEPMDRFLKLTREQLLGVLQDACEFQVIDIKHLANHELDLETADCTGIERFAGLALLTFQYAVSIVKGRREHSPQAFVSQAVRLMAAQDRWQSLPDRAQCHQLWPECPQKFGKYHRSGDSALHTAVLFSQTIVGAIKVAKCFALGTNPIDDVDEGGFASWQTAFVTELETTTMPTLTDWTMPELHRDSELIERNILMELRKAMSVHNGGVDGNEIIATFDAKRILNTPSDASLQRWAREAGVSTIGQGKWRKSDVLKIKKMRESKKQS